MNEKALHLAFCFRERKRMKKPFKIRRHNHHQYHVRDVEKYAFNSDGTVFILQKSNFQSSCALLSIAPVSFISFCELASLPSIDQ